ncbi:MAG: hypothetical protein ACR2MS_03080 [Weeksellaceae bacterium]
MLKSKNFQRFQFYWIIISVTLFFLGLVFASTSVLIGYIPAGQFLLGISSVSIIIYLLVSILQWFKFKKGNGIKNLITAYILLAALLILGGLIGAFLTYPQGMQFFLLGMGMLGGFWILKLIQFIFMKEEDFHKS